MDDGKKVDKLDRQDFIKFVENLIINSNNYKRNNESNSYVMALDSAWGTGKSYFIDLLIDDIQENMDVRVVKYNAWKNDYCKNAFNPLFYDILSSDIFEDEIDTKNGLVLVKSIGSIVGAFSKDVVKNIGLEKTGEAVNDTAVKLKDFLFKNLPEISELKEEREAFKNFSEILRNSAECLKDNKQKLVIVIDELDRCKPTFAIQTLEIVKHIFDIKNIVFLFAVDIEQLSHSISSIYGQGFDSVGYLCRFFDYIAKLPAPSMEKYISYKLSESKIDIEHSEFEKIQEYIVILSIRFDLSLRDIDTIIQSYKILYDTKLKDYAIVDVNLVYLFYLILKYKRPEVYHNIFISNVNIENTVGQLIKEFRYNLCKNEFFNASIDGLLNNSKLYKSKMNICTGSDVIVRNETISSVDGKSFRFNNDYKYGTIGDNTNWGKILFAPDLLKWNEISNYTYREYIHKQLENYNFKYNGADNGEMSCLG